MANGQNLVVPSSDEARKNGKKGGIASGKARRKKADFKKALNTILSANVANGQLASILESMGFERTNEAAVALITMQKALKGDMRAVELIARLNSNEGTKDALDRQEQKQRIKALELENKKREQSLSEGNKTEDALDKYFKELEGALNGD
ncbi:hypothetical protein [Streptococcus suis]|uniref:hypothetical protein n=1 Tax=Streptococcus suis TaxID=1307 RepID=UPI0007A57CB4|nr:stress-induced protein [Streptococcus suis]